LQLGAISGEPLETNMETGACFGESAAIGKGRPLALDIREGDWTAYRQSISDARNQNAVFLENYGGILGYRRKCALAYLGRRAQLHGGVCSRTQPRILTDAFVADMGERNRSERFRRYPWLEKLLNLLAEIERVQDEIGTSANIISLVPVSKSE
jgi:hypothetical protein